VPSLHSKVEPFGGLFAAVLFAVVFAGLFETAFQTVLTALDAIFETVFTALDKVFVTVFVMEFVGLFAFALFVELVAPPPHANAKTANERRAIRSKSLFFIY